MFLCIINLKNSEIISENMKKSGIFRNVFDIGLFKEYPGLCQKAATLNRMFFPVTVFETLCD